MSIAAKPNTFVSSPLNLSTARTAIVVTLIAWISASALMDFVIMPGLYVSGMMSNSGFAAAGDMIFSMFNRVELAAGALVLTGTLLWWALTPGFPGRQSAIALASVLFVIPFIYTYGLTPQMSGLGIQLSLFETAVVPESMDHLHYVYWSFEVLKLAAGGVLLSWLWNNQPQAV
ncbi:hypothetical protein [Acaryochloris sp. IP29b_bin.137]|uniref:hypothetical protein n=1 Tax=Acaryochloris sp. IP29b_bin.137 TaxID=2969217 RepID=UPI00260684D9|nr:hypothetical protein [Acaryochloris sp. IP29b_bin.137]